MKQRGRNTAGGLKVVDTVEVCPRLAPPAELSEYEASVWHSVVNTKPAEWFQADTRQLLIAYCKHCSTALVLDSQLDEFKPQWLADSDGLDRYRKLTDMREKQTRAINALSRSMRLTQQARYDTQKAAVADRKASGKKPWEG